MEIYIIIFFTGIGVSFISTLFGLGGGIIMVPILSLILPYSHLEAVATSLAAIVLVAAFNTYNYSKKDVIVWNIVPWIAVTSIIFGFISPKISVILNDTVLIVIFILFLFWVAVRTFLIDTNEKKLPFDLNKKYIPLGIGSLSGTISGFTGIGGGGVTTPLMLITGMTNNIQAAPTSNAIMIFTTLFASLSYALMENVAAGKMVFGYIHMDTSLLLFLGSAAFSRVGVKINNLLPLFWRKTILGIILLFVSIRLLWMVL